MVKVKPTLKDAANVKIVWEKTPDLRLGNIGLSDFLTMYNATDALDKDYIQKDVGLSGIRDTRDNKARDLQAVITRFRSAGTPRPAGLVKARGNRPIAKPKQPRLRLAGMVLLV
jgi:hypothetical protein